MSMLNMISITVRHQTVRQQAANNQQEQANKSRATMSLRGQPQDKSISSQLQVKYQPSAHRSGYNVPKRAQHVLPPPLPAARQRNTEHKQPRGSLSSCSSSSPDLSGTGETETETEPDESYSCVFKDENNSNETYRNQNRAHRTEEGLFGEEDSNKQFHHQSSNCRSAKASIELGQPEANSRVKRKPTATEWVVPKTVHSRSISLIINPQFDSSDSDSGPVDQSKFLKSSFRRRTVTNRVRFMRERNAAVRLTSKAANMSLKREEKEEHPAVGTPAEAGETRPEPGPVEGPIGEKGSEEEEEATGGKYGRLRHIGFLLRQLSDEFSR